MFSVPSLLLNHKFNEVNWLHKDMWSLYLYDLAFECLNYWDTAVFCILIETKSPFLALTRSLGGNLLIFLRAVEKFGQSQIWTSKVKNPHVKILIESILS